MSSQHDSAVYKLYPEICASGGCMQQPSLGKNAGPVPPLHHATKLIRVGLPSGVCRPGPSKGMPQVAAHRESRAWLRTAKLKRASAGVSSWHGRRLAVPERPGRLREHSAASEAHRQGESTLLSFAEKKLPLWFRSW